MAPEQNRFGRSKLLKCLAVFVGLLLLAMAIFAWSTFSTQNQAAVQIDAIRQSGLPTTGAELNEFYRPADGVRDTTTEWMAATQLVNTDEFNQKVRALPVLGVGGDAVLPGTEWPQLEESRTTFNTVLKEELTAVRMAAEAGGQVRFPVDFAKGVAAQFPDTLRMRTVARLLRLDAYIAAHDGDDERVAQDIRHIIRTSDALASEPAVTSQLIRLAIYGVAVDSFQELFPHCQWSDETLVMLQHEFARADFRQEFRRALIGERSITLESLDALPALIRANNKLLAIELLGNAIDACDQSWPAVMECGRATGDRLVQIAGDSFSKYRYSGVLLMLPAISQTGTGSARAEAMKRAAVVAIALYRHRLNHGEFPSALQDSALQHGLIAGEQESLIMDPFTDQVLQLQTTADGFVLYSIGPNLKDDDGSVEAEESWKTLDIGLRLKTTSTEELP